MLGGDGAWETALPESLHGFPSRFVQGSWKHTGYGRTAVIGLYTDKNIHLLDLEKDVDSVPTSSVDRRSALLSTMSPSKTLQADAEGEDLLAFMTSDLYPIPQLRHLGAQQPLHVLSVTDVWDRFGIGHLTESSTLHGLEPLDVTGSFAPDVTDVSGSQFCWLSKIPLKVCFAPHLCLRLDQRTVVRAFEPVREEDIVPVWEVDWSQFDLALPCFVLAGSWHLRRMAASEAGGGSNDKACCVRL